MSKDEKRLTPLVETETTQLQRETEDEVAPFFVELSSLPYDQIEHLFQVGLLPRPETNNDDSVGDDNENIDDDGKSALTTTYNGLKIPKIQLLREKHKQYLEQVWMKPLKHHFVTLDASRPWILYWCLHGYDLLNNENFHDKNKRNLNITNEHGLNMIATLEDCWQSYYISEPPSIVYDDNNSKDTIYFSRHEQDIEESDNRDTSYQYYCGGFGGGPGQIAHAATTYAAVLSLCILATDNFVGDDMETNDDSSNEMHYSVKALEVLENIRLPLYRWMVSLQEVDTGGYRMHHDGEVDVRATYTIMTCAKLLKLLPSTTKSTSTTSTTFTGGFLRLKVIDFVVSCQTFEGGLGGEPFSEAHGGYTFCGVAACWIMGALQKWKSNVNGSKNSGNSYLDIPSLVGWLSRRQMSFEGGFCGRSNKLVDGCYSFWQGAAMAIASSCYADDFIPGDPWLQLHEQTLHDQDSTSAISTLKQSTPFPLLFDGPMLERYILLCAQEIHGGLRDKPSKPRDFYHTCYNVSGLSVAQHCCGPLDDTDPAYYGDPQQTRVAPTHPCYNLRIDRVASILKKQWKSMCN